MAGDDEEGVVDADGESQHQGQRGRRGAERDHTGQCLDAQQAQGDSDQRHEQWHACGNQGSERDQENQEPDQHAVELAVALCPGGCDHAPGELDVHPGRLEWLGDVLEGLLGLVTHLVHRHGVGTSAKPMRLSLLRVGADTPNDLRRLGNLGERRLRLRAVRRFGERVPSRRRDHDPGCRAAGAWELL